MSDAFIAELVSEVKSHRISSKDSFFSVQHALLKKHHLSSPPSMIQVMTRLSKEDRKILLPLLQTKPVRTVSGVAPVAIMTKPMACPPQAKCTYCPGGPKSVFGDVPKSYTGNEPASMRAARNKFSAYAQVMNRLEQYALLNQSMEKIELIIMGGTFMYYPKEYRDEFVTEALQAMNDFSSMFFRDEVFDYEKFLDFFELPDEVNNPDRTARVLEKLNAHKSSSLEKEQERNETAKIRCVAMVIETRPDNCSKDDINEMLRLGTTRVELGIQSTSDAVLEKVERGHSVQDSVVATRLLKDSFLKACYQVMPGLYQGVDESTRMIQELFDRGDFRPDALKMYPALVMPGTKLFEQYKQGLFKPLSTEEAAEVIASAYTFIPKYCRVMRIQRDIPTKVTVDGVSMTNFRQYVEVLMQKRNIVPKDIRSREPRLRPVDWDAVKLLRYDYDASEGKEVFLSLEDTKNDILLGFLRLRVPSRPFRSEITDATVGVRELHVYGTSAALSDAGDIQHRGLGKQLMAEAERIAKEEFSAKKIAVISGIGVRQYYYKLGYVRDGVYVSKELR